MFKLKILKYLEKGDSLGLLSMLQKEGLGHRTVTQLHQLVTMELSSERFSRVQLVVQALDKLCQNTKDLQTLLTTGLISKLLWWYECVFDKLTCDLSHSTALNNLTGAFFDYFLELAKPFVPVNELRVILTYLCRTALDTTIAFRLRLEAIRTFNSCMETSSPDQRKVLQAHHDIKCILSDMAAALFTAGDYELQASITETLCRLTLKVDREIRAKEWFVPELSVAFTAIRNPYFETDCRHFLNFLNKNQGDQRRVFTFPCLQAFLDSTQLSRPQDEDVGEFWIDFNLGSECVSFSLDNPNKETCSLWQSIQVLRTQVNRYSLTEVNGVSVLDMDLIKPILLENLTGQRLEIRFKADLHGELSRVICRVFKKPSVPVSFMRTYRKKTPKKKLRVLPLSSPSSEEDSVLKSPERSRAKILFDQIQHSTPIYKCGVRWAEQTHGCSSTTELGGSIRKRPFPDSGYLSDHTRTSPKSVSPTESVRSPKPKEAKEKRVDGTGGLDAEEDNVDVRVGLDAEEDMFFGDALEPSAEENRLELEKAQSSAEGTEAVSEKVGSVSEGAGTEAEGGRSLVDVTGSLAEEARPVREGVELLADGARSTAVQTESHDGDEEPVAEEEPLEGVESVIELEPAKFKLELATEGAPHFPDPVDLQVTNSAESLVFEQSEELRANTDIIASLKSQFEQQLTSQWQQVENQLVQFQSETCTHMSGLLSTFQEYRVVHAQMLQDTVWNWKALEDFHTTSSGIMSFMKAENQRVMSFCQQQILRLKSSEMERASEKRGSSTVLK